MYLPARKRVPFFASSSRGMTQVFEPWTLGTEMVPPHEGEPVIETVALHVTGFSPYGSATGGGVVTLRVIHFLTETVPASFLTFLTESFAVTPWPDPSPGPALAGAAGVRPRAPRRAAPQTG